ncbi:MAG: co-chaperone GroES [Caldithrix sp.]|nr:co-chaperone GroES [Caldithrix sp.]
MDPKKDIVIVGDRVLIRPDDKKERTQAGLYLPQGVESREKVQGGIVTKVGPGYPLPDPNTLGDKPWEQSQQETSYLPLQAEEGDYALFLRKAAIEIEIDREKYIIVPQAAILLLIRENILDNLKNE